MAEEVTIEIDLDGDKKAIQSLSRLASKMDKVKDANQATAREVRKGRKQFGRFVGVLTKVAAVAGTAMVGFRALKGIVTNLSQKFIEATRTAGKFRFEIAKAAARADATKASMEQFEKAARQASSTSAFGASQAAEALTELSKAGFSAAESTEALRGVLRQAAAGNVSTAEAASTATGILKSFRLETDQLRKVNNALVKASTTSKTTVQNLGKALGVVGSAASQAGLSLEKTTAFIAKMQDKNLSASRASITLRRALAVLSDPTSQARKELEAMGIQLDESADTSEQLFQVLEQLQDSGNKVGQMAQVLGVRAGPTLQAALTQGVEGIKEYAKELENAGGVAKEIEQFQLQNLEGQLQIIQGSMNSLVTKAFEPFSRGASRITHRLNKKVNALRENERAVRNFQDAIIQILPATGQLASNIMGAVGGAVAAIDILDSLATTGMQVAKMFVMLQNPVEAAENIWNSWSDTVGRTLKLYEASTKAGRSAAQVTKDYANAVEDAQGSMVPFNSTLRKINQNLSSNIDLSSLQTATKEMRNATNATLRILSKSRKALNNQNFDKQEKLLKSAKNKALQLENSMKGIGDISLLRNNDVEDLPELFRRPAQELKEARHNFKLFADQVDTAPTPNKALAAFHRMRNSMLQIIKSRRKILDLQNKSNDLIVQGTESTKKLEEGGEGVADAFGKAKEGVSEAIGAATEKANEQAKGIAEAISEASDEAGEAVEEATDRTREAEKLILRLQRQKRIHEEAKDLARERAQVTTERDLAQRKNVAIAKARLNITKVQAEFEQERRERVKELKELGLDRRANQVEQLLKSKERLAVAKEEKKLQQDISSIEQERVTTMEQLAHSASQVAKSMPDQFGGDKVMGGVMEQFTKGFDKAIEEESRKLRQKQREIRSMKMRGADSEDPEIKRLKEKVKLHRQVRDQMKANRKVRKRSAQSQFAWLKTVGRANSVMQSSLKGLNKFQGGLDQLQKASADGISGMTALKDAFGQKRLIQDNKKAFEGIQKSIGAMGGVAMKAADQFKASMAVKAGIAATFQAAQAAAATAAGQIPKAALHGAAAGLFGSIAVGSAVAQSQAPSKPEARGGMPTPESVGEDIGKAAGEELKKEERESRVEIYDFSGATLLEDAPTVEGEISDAREQARGRAIGRDIRGSGG